MAVDEGQKCFVTSNSKTLVERLAAALAHRFGSGRRVLLITSSTVSSEEVQGFISDPASRIRDYDVVLTSPSLGTGVDISLADNSKLVDVVFGFFEPHTNHFEIDQQLARVRDPGAIKVWITARRWNYETEFEIVREDIMRQSLFKNVLKGYTAEGAPQYDATDPFINMAALIVSRDRASKNNLRKHFVEHKRQQGYEVQSVSKDEDRSAIGTDLLREGKQLFDQRLKEGLLRAAPMRKPDFEEVREALEGNDGVEGDDRWAYERTQLELFYRASATAALIEADRRGRYRKAIKLFEGITELQHRYGNGPPDLQPGSRVVKRGEESALAMLHLLQRTPIYRDGRFLISVIYGASVRPVVLTGADLGPFVRFCRDHKASIETLLGCEVRSDVETKPVQQLGAVLKLVGVRLKAAGARSDRV